ncbi:membrane dipeptidase [Paenibacillus sp. CGMCC 1.16610]|uniref:Membrane dipeptidase n=1 Tax=Paenibacillus anseongense TaxID=2682845 RepID=A0ABW9UBZ7_9BACL|nr:MULTISPECIES: dipeptidase [Paenibacillus]MBA2937757.1 membrane dipeptidase [Paenibacillus sp. CGMCC 1.16610]MVQ36815.1 membrane dipeptidase [Paenibacillus anseongense]
MKIMDGHCDALTKLYVNPKLDFGMEDQELDVNYPRLKHAGVKVQCFAIYLSDSIQQPTFEHILQMVDIFHRKIVSHSGMKFIHTVQDWHEVEAGDQIGAILTLEGVDALAGNLTHLRILYHLGVRSIGLTWNYANWAADGVMEPRKGGFTRKGKLMLRELETMGIIADVSHLSTAAFWEMVEGYNKPFIASHSNAQKICPHPRNLSDDQIKAIIQCQGQIGLTFVPYFVDSVNLAVPIAGLLKHIDHVCSLGGEKQIGFGSDFDGIEQWIKGLRHAGQYENLIEALCKNYQETQVEAFLFGNWRNFMLTNLPK